jgi:hypothetical protein
MPVTTATSGYWLQAPDSGQRMYIVQFSSEYYFRRDELRATKTTIQKFVEHV